MVLTWAFKIFWIEEEVEREEEEEEEVRKDFIPSTGHLPFLLFSNFAEIHETIWIRPLHQDRNCHWWKLMGGDDQWKWRCRRFKIMMNLQAWMFDHHHLNWLACWNFCASLCVCVLSVCASNVSEWVSVRLCLSKRKKGRERKGTMGREGKGTMGREAGTQRF